MKWQVAALAALGTVSANAQAADDDALVFEPSSVWAADFGDDYCRLTRDFSNGTDRVSILLDRIHGGNSVRLMVVGDAVKLYRGTNQLGYSYLPDGKDRTAMVVRSKTNDGAQLINFGEIAMGEPIVFGPPPKDASAPPPTPYSAEGEVEYASNIKGFLISEGAVKPVRINTGSMGAPIKAVQSCMNDLLKYWGLDAEKHKKLSRPVTPNEGMTKWVPTGTIGFRDFALLGGASNQIRLMVDATGKATSCHVHWASLDQTTNDKLCSALVKNASFQPALDSDGQAVASYFTLMPFMLMGPPRGR